ncbi:D-alanyl-D-alanine carboxypeptidase family protein [Roseomonas marmotae]|uniref:D-alanyl-D-alanine carboxypeptidase n=1 Tax=Roseomonas marmotae TaxID=2768161 RepID=A0ABS3KBE2_9PROT|nr:D-alanyl-D-alanine carboxypeptidase family protein [Roseomonas marmotae]MBO1074785.1 D-alanyl-D-alanine carboxypeptidase [Roseomonas marmotae]QTI80706.1 D-alanyl-D-alanine carboxypeptidase [Roseomonas marmotae]
MPHLGLAGCRVFAFALLAVVLTITTITPARAQIGSERYAALVIDAGTGEEFVSISADEYRYPASLTKMMTLYMAFEALQNGRLSPTSRIRVSSHAAAQPPSKLGLRAGGTITARDAMMAMVTRSANDAATALGEHLGGGSEANFARMMTARARTLGMSRTTFRNASGLPNPQQRTTARDMARLSQALLRDFPQRYAYFSVGSFEWNGRTIRGHNRLLDNYPGADGIKTGFINASGFNLAASAVRGGVRMIAVVFGGASSWERDAHVMSLLDRGFAEAGALPSTDMMMAGRRGPSLVGTATAAPVPSASVLARGGAGGSVRPVVSRPVVSRPAPARGSAAAGRWAVQVGAFAERGPAQAAARKAAAKGGRMEVERVKVKGNWFWRARVTGLSATAARSTCRGTRGPCMVISP